MEFLTDSDEVDIDTYNIATQIDDIMHREITDTTGITISHRDIQKFIVGIIMDNNRRQRRIQYEEEKIKKSMEKLDKKLDKIYSDKIKKGKVIKDLNSIGNIIKYYILNYALIRQVGCDTMGETARCDN